MCLDNCHIVSLHFLPFVHSLITQSPDQWTDITGTNLGAKRMGHSKTLPKELESPFIDPIRENEVAELQEFEIWEDAKSIPGSFVSDLPAWKEPQSTVRTVSPYPKPILQGGDDPNSEWETIAIDEESILKPSTRLRQRVEHGRLAFPVQDIMGRVRQATERAQRRNTDLIAPTSARTLAILPTFNTSNIPNDGLQRASSVYEDDKETCKPSHSSKQQAYTPEMSRALSKKRPFTLNFDRNVYGELVSSYSKSSSRASNDPFRYDGEGYSLFLNPSAEKEVSRALYRTNSRSEAASTAIYSPKKNFPNSMGRRFQAGSFYDNAVIQST